VQVLIQEEVMSLCMSLRQLGVDNYVYVSLEPAGNNLLS
jgi:hypothetical protein